MPRLRQLGQLAETLLGSHLKRRQLSYENDLLTERQNQSQQHQMANNLLQKVFADPKIASRLVQGGQTMIGGQDITPFAQTPDDAAEPLMEDIGKSTTPNMVKTDADILNLYGAQPGANHSGNNPQIAQLMQQAKAKRDQQMALLAPKEITGITAEDGSTTTRLVPGAEALKGGDYKTGLSASQQGVNEGVKAGAAAPGLASAQNVITNTTAGPNARAAGLKAGAVSNAEFPNQQALAQTRADLALQNATALDDYKRAHPKATAAELDQKAGADHALQMISDVRTMADEMDKRGLMGPLRGRGAQIASGQVKASDLFSKPEDAELAAQFFSEAGFLNKLAARVHGGTRAAGSPGMSAAFDKLFSGVGDRNIVEGQLKSVEQVMRIYAENPNAPALLQIPGMEAGAAQGAFGKLQELRKGTVKP